MNRRARDAIRRKGISLLRDWGTCPDCRERGTLAVSIQPTAGVFVIDCRSPGVCGMKREVPPEYLVRLGASAERVRSWLKLREASACDDPSAAMRDFAEELKKMIKENEKEKRRIFGMSWDELMGR